MDATLDDGRVGRWVNHSKKAVNAKGNSIKISKDKTIRAYFVATRQISEAEEVLYDYFGADKPSKNELEDFPWLLE